LEDMFSSRSSFRVFCFKSFPSRVFIAACHQTPPLVRRGRQQSSPYYSPSNLQCLLGLTEPAFLLCTARLAIFSLVLNPRFGPLKALARFPFYERSKLFMGGVDLAAESLQLHRPCFSSPLRLLCLSSFCLNHCPSLPFSLEIPNCLLIKAFLDGPSCRTPENLPPVFS